MLLSARGGTSQAGYFRVQLSAELAGRGACTVESVGAQYACVFAVRGAPSSGALLAAALAGDGGEGRPCLPDATVVGDGVRQGTLCCCPAEEVLAGMELGEGARAVCEVRGRLPSRLPPPMRGRFVRFLHVLLVAVRARVRGRGAGAKLVTRGFVLPLERRPCRVSWESVQESAGPAASGEDGGGERSVEVPAPDDRPLPPLWARVQRGGAACVLLSRLQWAPWRGGEEREEVRVLGGTGDVPRAVAGGGGVGAGVGVLCGGVLDVAGTRGLCSGLVWTHGSLRAPRRMPRSVTCTASDGKVACRLELARAASCPGSTLSLAVRMLSDAPESVPVVHVALQLEMLEGLRAGVSAGANPPALPPRCPALVRALGGAEGSPLVQWDGESRRDALVGALLEAGFAAPVASAWAHTALEGLPEGDSDRPWEPDADWVSSADAAAEKTKTPAAAAASATTSASGGYLATRVHPVRGWTCAVGTGLVLVPCHLDIPIDACPTARLPLVDVAWRLRVALLLARGRDANGATITELVQLILPVLVVPPTVAPPQGLDALHLDRLLSPLAVPRHVVPPEPPIALPALDPRSLLLPPTLIDDDGRDDE